MQETGYDVPDAARFSTSRFEAVPADQRSHSTAVDPAAGQLDRYNMQCKSLGMAIIINNKKFDPSLKLREREGTDNDATNLYRCFGQMGFKSISFKNNLKCEEIRKVLSDAVSLNHNEHAMFACAILSHGEMGKIYGTDGSMPLQDIFGIVKGGNSKGLEGKPKLFFIQACRGDRLDRGAIVTDSVDTGSEPRSTSYTVPVERDFLVVYSSTPGFYSWRNNLKGSYFISVLCEELSQNYRKKEIMKILTTVNRRVAIEFKSETCEKATSGMRQMPCFSTMLTKELYIAS